MPLAGRNADINITSVTATTSTGEAATASTGTASARPFVQVNSTARRIWDPDSTPVLYHNSTAVSSTAYNVNFVQGKFEATSTADFATGTYTADIEYLTASRVAGGREWQLGIETEAFEVSEFGSSGWREFQPNLAGASITMSRYWNDSDFFDLINSGNALFLVDLVINSANGWRYQTFARVGSDQINTSVDAIVNEQIQLQAHGQVYFTT